MASREARNLEGFMLARIAISALLGGCLVAAVVAQPPDFFRADRACVIHTEDSGGSPSVGRLEVGESAPILETNSTGKWVKIDHEGIVGWVFKSRGEVLASEPDPPSADEMQFFFGNIHAHTSEESSESNVAESTHEDAFTFAMDDSLGNLDFLAITPHNHLVTDQAYPNLLATVALSDFNKPGEFVPLAGQEFSSNGTGNHVNVFELDAWIDPSDVANGAYDVLFEDFVPAHDTALTFAQFNHPKNVGMNGHGGTEYGRDDFDTVAEWIAATDPFVQAMEIISAPSHDPGGGRPHADQVSSRVHAWMFALSEGWHVGPTANQDNHQPNWGTATDSRTVAIAPELTREAICEAFRARRFYASEDSTLEVTFRAGEAWMGSIVQADELSSFTVVCHDAEEPSATYEVQLHMGEVGGPDLKMSTAPADTLTLADGEEGTFFPEPIGGTFWFIRVTQSQTGDDPNGTEDDVWAAPIWVEGEAH